MPLERVDDVCCSDCLAASVLDVGDRIADHVLYEDLEDAARLLACNFVDALDAAAASQAADGGLGDALDGVAEHLAVALSAIAFDQGLAALATA